MTCFQLGDLVVATASVQALDAGREYRVRGVHEHLTPFGTFVTYELVRADFGGTRLPVRNGHLLLRRVSGEKGRILPC